MDYIQEYTERDIDTKTNHLDTEAPKMYSQSQYLLFTKYITQ
jgi:hypothetical protein